MSNTITIEPTQFTNLRSGEVTHGVRIYDNQACIYQNTWESVPDDDLEVLTLTIENADAPTEGLFDFVQEAEVGLVIGGEHYTWEQIKDCF